MATIKEKNTIAKDTSRYLPAKAIEGIIGVVTLILYTNYFSPSQYGDYNFILTTVNISSLFLIGWLMHSVTRYINEYSKNSELESFFTTVITIWFGISAVIITIGIITLLIVKPQIEYTYFIFYFIALFMFLSASGTQIMLSALAASRIIKLNIILSVFSVTSKVILTTIFVKLFDMNVEGALLSFLITDTIVVITAVFRLRIFSFVKKNKFNTEILKSFLHYGIPLVGFTLTMSILNMSDRYIIKFMLGSDDLGIYAANYTVASSVFTMIIYAVMKGVYPSILKAWTKKNKSEIEPMLSKGVRYFIIIALPTFAGLLVLSSSISKILLDEKYTSGYIVIPIVALGMIFYGLTEYNNKAWELSSKTKYIFIYGLISCIFNITANLIFIPIFKINAAAISTALAYILFFSLTYIKSRSILKWSLPFSSILKIGISTIIMSIVIIVLLHFLESNTLTLVICVFSGILVYSLGLFISKEIREETKYLFAFIKEKFNHLKG